MVCWKLQDVSVRGGFWDLNSLHVGAETPMLEDADEGGVKLWHLVKASEEPELPKHRRGSLRERERAKAIPEIYLTRLLSMKVLTLTGLFLDPCGDRGGTSIHFLFLFLFYCKTNLSGT